MLDIKKGFVRNVLGKCEKNFFCYFFESDILFNEREGTPQEIANIGLISKRERGEVDGNSKEEGQEEESSCEEGKGEEGSKEKEKSPSEEEEKNREEEKEKKIALANHAGTSRSGGTL